MPTYAQLLGPAHPMSTAKGPNTKARLPRKARAGKKARLSKPMTKAVQSLIRREADTKFVAQSIQRPDGGVTLNTYSGFSSAINTVNEIYACIPQVAVGGTTSSCTRMGDHISPTKCLIDLNIVATASNAIGAVDKMVHVFVLTSKSVKSLDNYTAIPITQLLDIGNGTNGPFNGTSMSQTLPVNTQDFTVLHHKAFRMTKGMGLQNTSIQTSAVITPASSFRRLRLNIKLPKKLTYADDSTNYPVNSAPFLVIGYTSCDSSGDTAPTAVDTYVEGRCQMWYKDM